MAEFRQGPRASETATMCEVAGALSDKDIEALAEHYAALPFHDSECSRCHSDGGSNPDDEASILAGQWMGYLESTFAEFASGARYQPDKMKEKMDPLTDEQVTALVHYYASQQ